jgi:hypothetical protein
MLHVGAGRSPHRSSAPAFWSYDDADPAMSGTVSEELLEAWQAVANAKLVEYRRQVWRLAILVKQGTVNKAAAVDRLWEIAIAHALVRALGEERVQAILAEAFADAAFHPMLMEAA